MEDLLTFLGDCVVIDKDLRGGVPCIKGTRIPVSQFLATLAHPDDQQIPAVDFADEYDIDRKPCIQILEQLAMYFNRSFTDGAQIKAFEMSLTHRDKELMTTGLYILECQCMGDELSPELADELDGTPDSGEIRDLMNRIKRS